jgi:PAS domain S-box-containing protein
MSLSLRFALRFGITAALTVGLVLAGAISLFGLRLDAISTDLGIKMEDAIAVQLRRDSDAMLDFLVEDTRGDLLAYDRRALDRIAREALRRSSAERVRIYDQYGRTIADGLGEEAAFETAAPPQLRGLDAEGGVVRWFEGDLMHSARAVCIAQDCVGAVSVAMDAGIIARERRAADRQMAQARRDFFIEAGLLSAAGILLGTLIAALVGWMLGRGLMRSIRNVIDGLTQLASGAADVAIETKEAELKELAGAVEKVAERMAVMAPEQDAILADMADGLFVAATDGHMIVANPALHDLLGAPPGSLVGASIFDRFSIDPLGDPEAICAALAEIREIAREDGTAVPVMISARISEDKSGKGGRIVGVMRDVADRVAVEQELVAAQMRAEAADRAKAEFLAVMSHELRTPLNGVLGGAAVLAGTELTPQQKGLVGMMQNSGRSLLTMVTNILDFSRTDSHAAAVAQEPVDLEEIARDIAASISLSAQEKGLAVDLRVQPDIPGVLSDPEKLLEIGSKLAENAVKFTDTGRVGIDISYDRDGEALAFTMTVADSGIGIDPDKRDSIFDLFTQADSSASRQHTGPGMGLSITKRLAELMGGEITVSSEPGEGSTFKVSLKAPLDPDAAPKPKPQALQGARTMVVSPSQSERDTLAEQLQAAGAAAEGFETAVAAREALEAALAEGQPFGLVVHAEDLADFEPSGLAQWLREDHAEGSPASVVVGPERPGMADLAALPDRIQRAAEPVTGSVLLDAADKALAARAPDADDSHDAAPAAAAATGLADEGPDLKVVKAEPKKPTVLLAEANEVNRIVLSAYLKKAGYLVETAENGFDAVRIFKEEGPSLVLMDVDMPVMSGIEATKAIRSHEIEENLVPIRIIGLSAARRDGDRERCTAVGMNDHLPKPIKIEELEAKLERWAHLAGRPQPAAAAS